MIKHVAVDYGDLAYEFRFESKLSRRLYGIDSVNLLLGENGSGKTTILKEIVKELVGGSSDIHIHVDGEVDSMGVVYFTPVPSRKSFEFKHGKRVNFIDASNYTGGKVKIDSSLINSVNSIFESFEINSKPIGVVNFNYVDVFFDLMRYSVRNERNYIDTFLKKKAYAGLSKEMIDIVFNFVKYDDLNKAYVALRDDIRLLGKGLRGIGFDGGKESEIYQKKEMLLSLNNERISLARSLKVGIEYYFTGTRNNLGYLAREPRAGYISGGCIDLIALLHLCTLDKNNRENFFRIVFSSEYLDRDVERLRSFVQAWHAQGAFEIKLDRRYVKVEFKVMEGGSLLKEPDTQYYHARGLISLGFDNLSSGEEAILWQCLALEMSIRDLRDKGAKNFFVIIDEGDMLLHLKWQREYIYRICALLSKVMSVGSMQLLIATHSAILASDVLKDSVTCLDIKHPGKIKAFGAPISNIYNDDFNALPVGAIAEREIKEMSGRRKKLTEMDMALISVIDDKFVREYFNVFK